MDRKGHGASGPVGVTPGTDTPVTFANLVFVLGPITNKSCIYFYEARLWSETKMQQVLFKYWLQRENFSPRQKLTTIIHFAQRICEVLFTRRWSRFLRRHKRPTVCLRWWCLPRFWSFPATTYQSTGFEFLSTKINITRKKEVTW